MGLSREHELHRRRLGRNLGVALVLAAFIALVFALTVVKVTRGDFEPPRAGAGGSATGGAGAGAEQ